MKLANNRIWVLILLIGALCVLPACGGGGGGGGSDSSNQVSLELGETTTVVSSTVGAGGDLIDVDNPDDPLDGMEIDIPAGAYQEETDFTVSYTPITSHSGNENLDPVTPLITIENGGEYADEIITVKIPVTIEDDYHYMAFYYNEITGGLEGIPEVEHDETSLTIATRHFSKIMVSRLGFLVLAGDATVDSGFKVTKDNWQFTNLSTHLSSGICSGMSIASLYYYCEKKKEQAYPPLFGSYNNGTSVFDIDDDQAIKLCSTIQWWDDNNLSREGVHWSALSKQKGDLWTYFMFIHSILLTGEPQYVAIFPPGKDAIGHAMVVYKKSGNDLYVSDPNLPKDQNVKIEFEWGSDDPAHDQTQLTGNFKPFESQWNKDSNKINFTEILYIGTSALIDSDFDDLWNQLDNETVPWNKLVDTTLHDDYPEYELKIIEKDDTGAETESDLTDGYKTTNNVIKVKAETYDFDPRITAYSNGSTTGESNGTQTIEITLNQGDNNIGFFIEAKRFSGVEEKEVWAWTDFKYVNIKLDKEDPQEASISVTNTIDEDVRVTRPCITPVDLKPGETWKQAYEPGPYTIIVASDHVVWNHEISLSAGENYVYDFEATQDCNYGKITVLNKTSHMVKLYYGEAHGRSIEIEASEEYDLYVKSQEDYKLDAQANISNAPICVGDQCKYWLCWGLETFTLDCQGVVWTISGSGTPCDYDPYL